jgi:hypothetical protein
VRTPVVAGVVAGLSLALWLGATSAAGQVREPEVQSYSFVSEAPNVYGFWVNPGATATGEPTRLAGHMTFDRPEGAGWSNAQYMLSLQAGPVAFGYRHDEFGAPGGFSQGDAYTLALGLATGLYGLGVSRTWRTVGPTEGSWEIGWVARSESGVSGGLVWRDVGSPEVRNTVRHERLLGALTYRPGLSPFSLSLQADYRLDGGKLRALRIGGSLKLIRVLEALALAEWDGGGDFEGFRLGVIVRQQTTTLTAGAGLDSNGDARTASAGVVFDMPRRR